MSEDLQPISWQWIKAVVISSLLVLMVAGWIMVPLSKLIEPQRLSRIPNWLRWVLVLPTAFLMGLISEVLPRVLFAVVEIVVNHELLFRPGVDCVIWQLWTPVLFVAGGVQMAPAYRFPTFVVVGGLKIAVAIVNMVRVFQFVKGGGSWNAVDPIINSPLWWNACVYALCLTGLCAFGVLLLKEALDQRWHRTGWPEPSVP